MATDDITRYRMFFRSHDLAGAPQPAQPALRRLYEVRTPLNAIIGFAEVLEGEYFGSLTPRQRAYVRDIRHAARDLLTREGDVQNANRR